MESLIYMSYKIEPIFYKIVSMSLIASLIGIVIFIIRQVLKKQISPTWISRIWLVFIISLIIPINLKSSFSIYNIVPNEVSNIEQISYAKDKYYGIENEDLKIENQDIIEVNAENSDVVKSDIELDKIMQKTETTKKYNIQEFIPIIWFALVITMLFAYILTYIFFEIKISKVVMQDVILNDILRKAKQKLGIKRKIKLVDQKIINMPSILGIFNIRILLNQLILTQTDKEIEHIFLHELAHYKRKDNILNILITILRCIYIYNPIIWILLNQVKKDMELATDEIAMLDETKEEQKEYCKTLVKLSVLNPDMFLIQTMCLSEDRKILERRIEAMKLSEKFKEKKIFISIISILIIAILAVVFFTRSNRDMSYEEIISLMNTRDKYNNVYYEISVESNKEENKSIIKNYWKDGILVSKDENLISYSNFNTNEYISINNLYKEVHLGNNLSMSDSFNNLYESELNYNDILFKYNYIGILELDGIKVYKIELVSSENDEIRRFYIDVNTGFVIQFELYTKVNDIKMIKKYKYEIDIVKDEDIIKPNLDEYKEYQTVME